MNRAVFHELQQRFRRHFGLAPAVAAYAPGRIEVLGNHTDYNDGFVLSAAIDRGTWFAAAPAPEDVCRVVAGDLMEETRFAAASPGRSADQPWSNYVRGVAAGLGARFGKGPGFLGMFLGDIPLGAGLSSSAALEVSTGLALCALWDVKLDLLELARIGQAAEHDYAGVKCGLLDQITSLFGRAGELVMSDFRTLEIETLPLGGDVCFLMCNTAVKHALVDSEYNRRRASCEAAAAAFAARLDHPVTALRDVSWEEWERYSPELEPEAARRAAHVIGENRRVRQGRRRLAEGDLASFGRLMFESHESSRTRFENSCPELDLLVEAARGVPGVLGARLSGGGFGGSAVVLVHPRDAETAARALAAAYERAFGHPCETCAVAPSDGAARVA